MFAYIKARINHPPPTTSQHSVLSAGADGAAGSSNENEKDANGWPPPQPMGGMPCGVMPAQFAVQVHTSLVFFLRGPTVPQEGGIGPHI